MLYVVFFSYMVAAYRISDLVLSTKYKQLRFPILATLCITGVVVFPGNIGWIECLALSYSAMFVSQAIGGPRPVQNLRAKVVMLHPSSAYKEVIDQLLFGDRELWVELKGYIDNRVNELPNANDEDRKDLDQTFSDILNNLQDKKMTAIALHGMSRYWPKQLRGFIESKIIGDKNEHSLQ